MLGVKALVKKKANNWSKSHGGNVTGRLVESCIRRSSNFLRRSDHRPYSNQSEPPSPGGPFGGRDLPLFQRLAKAWTDTPTKWYPLPIAVGALLLIVMQYRKKRAEREVHVDDYGREVLKLKGPWHVHVIGALPLRNLSRVWGYLNSLELPVWFRPIGFKVYSKVFGCNLDEIETTDLTQYKSLGDFFYRKLKDGVRPAADTVLVSPADGTILHFGTIVGGKVEQVKGSTYSLDALLGVESPVSPPGTPVEFPEREMSEANDKDFADINGIEYSLSELLGGSPANSGTSTPATTESSGASLPEQPHHHPSHQATKFGEQVDASVSEEKEIAADVVARHTEVASELGVRTSLQRRKGSISDVKPGNSLFFAVIYLAPGDYHRFHSPTAWVVEKRRHFVGDLFSVSPWMARRLENLFVLNERVALLGRWKYGFFSMVPVGATNVGSIRINFDEALRTNVGSKRSHPLGTYTEAIYSAASPILGGQPLLKAQEMGGFCLGSTIVLVFEAPSDFKFTIEAGQKIKVGQAMGDVGLEQEVKR
ncbi:Phosphatidylserine decarboxylase proenzyme 1, mitochondrial [Abortiporus biennis]